MNICSVIEFKKKKLEGRKIKLMGKFAENPIKHFYCEISNSLSVLAKASCHLKMKLLYMYCSLILLGDKSSFKPVSI